MIKKLMFLIVCFSLLKSVTGITGTQTDFDALCSLTGFTIIDCSRARLDTEIHDPSAPIELINGMLFRPRVPISYLGGSSTLILAAKVEVGGRETLLYKLVMEFEPMPIDVYRIR